MTVTLTKWSLHRTSDPGQAFIYVQKQSFLCSPPPVKTTTPEQCSREQKGAQQCIVCVHAACFSTSPFLPSCKPSPPLHSLLVSDHFQSLCHSPRQNSSTPICLVVRMLPNLQQGSYGSFSEQCTSSCYTSSIYRAVTYHIQSIIHLK